MKSFWRGEYKMKGRRIEDETKLQITKYKLQTNHKLQCPKLQTKKPKEGMVIGEQGR